MARDYFQVFMLLRQDSQTLRVGWRHEAMQSAVVASGECALYVEPNENGSRGTWTNLKRRPLDHRPR